MTKGIPFDFLAGKMRKVANTEKGWKTASELGYEIESLLNPG